MVKPARFRVAIVARIFNGFGIWIDRRVGLAGQILLGMRSVVLESEMSV
jgi:hypothetical protein